MPVLVIRVSGKEPMKYEMTEDQITIGRDRANTVTLSGDSGLSGTHCRIRSAGRSFVVEDAGSANGSRLHGKLLGKGGEPLRSGDTIRIGSTDIVFDDPLSPKRTWFSSPSRTAKDSSPARFPPSPTMTQKRSGKRIRRTDSA